MKDVSRQVALAYHKHHESLLAYVGCIGMLLLVQSLPSFAFSHSSVDPFGVFWQTIPDQEVLQVGVQRPFKETLRCPKKDMPKGRKKCKIDMQQVGGHRY